jgi:hypothetical protein
MSGKPAGPRRCAPWGSATRISPRCAERPARRVLQPGGRVAIYTTGPELKGTPAAPEPIASRGTFYSDAELGDLAERAGLRDAAVRNDRGGQLLAARA